MAIIRPYLIPNSGPYLPDFSRKRPPTPPKDGDPAHRSPCQTRLTTPYADAAYHVTSRVNGDLPLWGEEEKHVMRAQLEKTATFCGVKVLNFILLENHFHLLVRVPALDSRDLLTTEQLLTRIQALYGEWTSEMLAQALSDAALAQPGTAHSHFGTRFMLRGGGDARIHESAKEWAERELERYRGLMHDLSLFVRLFKHRFSVWYNNTHDRFGTLWADRFRSMLVEDTPASLVAMSAYVDMNAVRAELVENPSAYPFCGIGEATRTDGMAREGLRDLLRTEQEKCGASSEASIGASDEVEGPTEAPPKAVEWSEMADRYRQLLWGDRIVKSSAEPSEEIAASPGDATSSSPTSAAVASAPCAAVAAAIAGVPSSLRDLPPTHERDLVLADFFRWRQDVFLKAAAMGSKSFIERIFWDNRESFGASLETAAQMVLIRGIGGGWRFEGMRVLPKFRLPPSRFDDG